MKLSRIINFIVAVVICILTACSCEEFTDENVLAENSYALHFDVTYSPYKGEDNTRATDAGEWKDVDTVYVYLDSPIRAYAIAIYDKPNNHWTFRCNKKLVDTSFAGCTIWTGNTNTYYSLASAYYTDEGCYSVSGESITLNATLKPYQRRIRFRYEKSDYLPDSGMPIYVDFDGGHKAFKYVNEKNMITPFGGYSFKYYHDTSDNISCGVNGLQGYSDYAVFSLEEDVRTIRVGYRYKGTMYYYTRYFDDNTLKFGESGCYTLPNMDNSEGWTFVGTHID